MTPRLPRSEGRGGGGCRWVEELLPWYATGTLEAGEWREVRRHLRHCRRCRAALAAVDRLSAALAAVPATLAGAAPEPAHAPGDPPVAAARLRLLRTLLSAEGWCGMGLPRIIAEPLGWLCLLVLGGRPPTLPILAGLAAPATRRTWDRVLDLMAA